jgi:hypothetical protein
MARCATWVEPRLALENATVFAERRSECSFSDTECVREATIQVMDAQTRFLAPSGTAAWSRLRGVIERLLSWLTSSWRAPWTMPLLELEGQPTHFLETRVNGRGCTLPLLRDANGCCDAIAAAGELANQGGGLEAALVSTTLCAARVWLSGCAQSAEAPARIAALAGQLLQIGMEASPQRWMPLGCIPALEVHDHGGGALGVTLYTECGDAMGRSAIEAAARAMAGPLAGLAECKSAPAIQLGHVEATRAKVRCRLSVEQLLAATASEQVIEAPLRALGDEVLSWFGVDRHQPELAAAHNGFILDGVSAAATALGLEAWRFVAAAQSHAARWGSCEPLARWRRQGDELWGQIEIPIDLESACMALPFVGDDDVRREAARRRVQLVAGAGLFASLAYVRAALASSLQQRKFGAVEGLPAQPVSAGRLARDSEIAESGVRLAAGHAASRTKAG